MSSSIGDSTGEMFSSPDEAGRRGMRERRDKREGSIQDGRTWPERLYEWFSYPSRHGNANPSIDDKYPHIPQKVVIVTRMGTAMRGDGGFGRLPTPSVQHSACLSSAVRIVALP